MKMARVLFVLFWAILSAACPLGICFPVTAQRNHKKPMRPWPEAQKIKPFSSQLQGLEILHQRHPASNSSTSGEHNKDANALMASLSVWQRPSRISRDRGPQITWSLQSLSGNHTHRKPCSFWGAYRSSRDCGCARLIPKQSTLPKVVLGYSGYLWVICGSMGKNEEQIGGQTWTNYFVHCLHMVVGQHSRPPNSPMHTTVDSL